MSELTDVLDVVDKLAGDPNARQRLAELGLWTVGADEGHGGGGDPFAAAAVVERLAQHDAALAWGAVQAHAAAAVLGGSARWGELLGRIHAGAAGVAVTAVDADPSAPGARIARVDAGEPRPWIIALAGPGLAWVIPPEATAFEPLRSTGLDGACTGRAVTTGPLTGGHLLDGVDTVAAQVILRLGAAAAARGLTAAAMAAASLYCGVRRQFGAPLTELATVRDALYLGARAAATIEVPSLDPGGVAPERAAALADAACEVAVRVTAEAVQLHGGYGYLAEYRVEKLLRDAVSLRAACDAAAGRRAGALAFRIGPS